jgi:MFS family permease
VLAALDIREADERFVRDRPTALSYASVGIFAYILYAFGPALALLRPALHLTYGEIALHASLWNAAALAGAACFVPAARRAGRGLVLWTATLGTCLGAGLFAVAPDLAVSLSAAVIMGSCGTVVLTATTVVLADRHGHRREQALVEANIGSGLCAVVAPAVLAGLGQVGVTWRLGMLLPLVALVLVYAWFRRTALPAAPTRGQAAAAPAADPVGDDTTCAETTGPARRNATGAAALPRRFWALALLVALGSATEFVTVYFAAELLSSTVHLSTAGAASALSLFYAGILVGRIAGGGLTRVPGRGVPLLAASLTLTLAGFVAFWLSGSAVVALAGLAVSGVGVANLYPLSVALALAVRPERSDTANSRVQMLTAATGLTAPLLLGNLADHVGLKAAFAVEPALLLLSVPLLVVGAVHRREN